MTTISTEADAYTDLVCLFIFSIMHDTNLVVTNSGLIFIIFDNMCQSRPIFRLDFCFFDSRAQTLLNRTVG